MISVQCSVVRPVKSLGKQAPTHIHTHTPPPSHHTQTRAYKAYKAYIQTYTNPAVVAHSPKSNFARPPTKATPRHHQGTTKAYHSPPLAPENYPCGLRDKPGIPPRLRLLLHFHSTRLSHFNHNPQPITIEVVLPILRSRPATLFKNQKTSSELSSLFSSLPSLHDQTSNENKTTTPAAICCFSICPLIHQYTLPVLVLEITALREPASVNCSRYCSILPRLSHLRQFNSDSRLVVYLYSILEILRACEARPACLVNPRNITALIDQHATSFARPPPQRLPRA